MSEQEKTTSDKTEKRKSDKKASGKSGKQKALANQLEIKLTAAFFVLLFIGMIGYLGHFVATSEQDMINNSYNSRQEILLSRNYRGSILSRDGEVLAETILDAKQNETRNYPFANLFSHIVGYSTQAFAAL